MTEPLSYRAPPPYPAVLRFRHAVDREATIACATVGTMETLPHSRGDPILRCHVSTPGSDLPLAGKYHSELSDVVITCGGDGNHDCRMHRIRERPGAPANFAVMVNCERAVGGQAGAEAAAEAARARAQAQAQQAQARRSVPVDPEQGFQGEVAFNPPPIPGADLTCLRTVPLFDPAPVYIYQHGPSGL